MTSFQRVAHLAKRVSMQQHLKQFVEKERRLESKFVGISEAEKLRFDCLNLFSLQGQCRAQFRFMLFRHIEIRLAR